MNYFQIGFQFALGWYLAKVTVIAGIVVTIKYLNWRKKNDN